MARPLDPTGVRYDQMLRLGPPGWWRPVVGLLFLLLLVVIAQAGAVVGGMGWLLLNGTELAQVDSLLLGDPVTPTFLAVVNLGWALTIPAVWLVVYVVHRMRPRWVTSVFPRMRWGWFFVCIGLAAAALVVTVAVSALLPATRGSVSSDGGLNPWTDQMRDFLLVVLLLTPLQAAGEEYAFRGYLTQACGSLTGSRIVAVLVPALIFALAHGLGQDWPVFLDRFGFGVVAGVLVIATGGLEAAIAMHVLNNFLAFGLALAFGDMTETLNPSGGSWWGIVVTLTQSVSYLALALLAGRALGVRAKTLPPRGHAPGVLAGPARRV